MTPPDNVLPALILPPMLITNPKYGQVVILCVSMILWFLIQFHAALVNRRIDALIELMEEDHAASHRLP